MTNDARSVHQAAPADPARAAVHDHAELDALIARCDRYRTLFEALDIGLCVVKLAFDTAGRPCDVRYVETNPAFTAQAGMADLLTDRARRWFDILASVAVSGIPVRMEQAASGPEDRWYDLHAFRIDHPAEAHVAVLSTDVTDRRRSERTLRTLNATLDSRAAEAAHVQEVAQAALRQSQRLEAIGQLTGGVAHDFNNLLTVIRGSVDLLRRPDLPVARARRYIDAIGETADRAAHMTGQLLAFARRQSLAPAPFDAAAALCDARDMLGTLLGPCIPIALDLPDGALPVLADHGQFDAAIVNLGINARDAMQGGGSLAIEARAVEAIPPVRTHTPVAGAYVAITLRDTGSGIAPQNMDRIFEPFFTTKAVGVGTGLGLSQVIGFAKQSGGDVLALSTPGEGTSITLYLPRATTLPVEDEADVAQVGSAIGHGLCVLVVDDNQQVGAFAAQALEALGHESILVPDAARAIAELSRDRQRFGLVFSDVMMPGMNGMELGAEVHRRWPDLPVVLTSGYSHGLAEPGQHGFALLRKPYTVDQLAQALRTVTDGPQPVRGNRPAR